MVLSKRALPDEYRQRNSSSCSQCSQLYPFSPMISVSSFSPHLSLRIPEYASLSLGWSPTHQVPSKSFHDCVFDSSGRRALPMLLSAEQRYPSARGQRNQPVVTRLDLVAFIPRFGSLQLRGTKIHIAWGLGQHIGGRRVAVEPTGLELGDPDLNQIAADPVAPG